MISQMKGDHIRADVRSFSTSVRSEARACRKRKDKVKQKEEIEKDFRYPVIDP